jgi:hypothetical protein
LKYGQPIWKIVLDAARAIEKETFTAKDIIEKVHETYPEIPATSISAYVIAMAPNHPSSYIYASTHKNHRYFEYLGNGKYRLMKDSQKLIKPKECPKFAEIDSEESKTDFLEKYKESIVSWTIEKEPELISGRKNYSWNGKSSIECLNERNCVAHLLVLSRIRNGGGVDIETVNNVLSWGGFRPLPLSESENVLRITFEAFNLLDEGKIKEALLKIMSINRIGVSSASKIIGLFDQNRLAIYDSRVGTALRSLTHNGIRIIKCPPGRSRPGDTCSENVWANNYEQMLWVLEVTRNYLIEKGYPFSIADVEMALFMMGK